MAANKKQKKQKRRSRATTNRNAQAEEEPAEEQTGEQATPEDNEDVDMNDPVPDSETSDDEPPTAKKRRHKKRKRDDWANVVMQKFANKKGAEIKSELQSPTPDFSKIETGFQKANRAIQKANEEHGVSPLRNAIPEAEYKIYRNTYNAWSVYVRSASAEDDYEKGWEAYDQLHKIIHLFNRENHLPEDWNFPPDTTEELFGERPDHLKKPSDLDTDSAAEYSDESESDESDSDEPDGIDGLESRMQKEYSSLSRGKVLYWWPVGTGTQVFVRYGSKKSPIYRVRAGSSQPYDPRTTERVLNITPGNSKSVIKSDGVQKEVWNRSRNDILGIIGVGWKVEDDDEADTNALALIRPQRHAIYPHTRVLVKWSGGGISLERRGFVRRIAYGNSFNGDRIIYLKAKELENAYWGYDVEQASNNDSDDGESDTDSVTSPSNHDPASTSRRSKGHTSGRKSKSSKKDIEAKILRLTEEVNRLNFELGRGGHDRTRSGRNRHQKSHN